MALSLFLALIKFSLPKGGKIMKLRYHIIFLTALLLITNFSFAQNQAQKELQKGINYYNNADIPNAITSLQKAIKLDPKNSKAFYYLGLCFEKQSKNTDALDKFNKAINLKKDYFDALLAKGRVLIKMKQFNNSLEPLNKIVSIYTEKSLAANALLGETYYQIGLAYYNLKNNSLAETNIKKCLEINPKHSYAHYYLGLVYYNEGKKDLAIEHLKIFLQLSPDAPEAPQVQNLLAQIAG